MRLVLRGMYFTLFFMLMISCTPAKVDFSGSQLNNLKYTFSSNDPAVTSLTLYTNQNSSVYFKTSDKTLDSLTVKLSYEILSAEKFDISQVFSNYSDSITIPAGSNSFSINFQTKATMPFTAGSADLKITITSPDDTINFSPGEFKIKLINQASAQPTISFNALNYINSLNQAVYLFSGNCGGVTNFTLLIDSLEYLISCTGGTWTQLANLTSLAQGSYTVYAKDTSKTTTYQSSSVTKDTVAPTISSINDSISHGSTTNSPIISWSSSDLGAGIQKIEIALGSSISSQDKFPWTDIGVVSSYQMTGLTLTSGNSYYVQLRATDNAGNISTSYPGDGFLVDTSLPVAGFNSAPPPYTNVSSYSINVTGASVIEYSYKYGLSGSVICSSPTGYSALIPIATPIPTFTGSEGTYKLCIIGKNTLGNMQSYASATQLVWTYDTTTPTLSITYPSPGSYVNESNKSNYSVTTTCSENGQNVSFYAESTVNPSFTDTAVSSCSSNLATAMLNVSTFPEGGLKIKSYQMDSATNTGYSSYVNVTKDTSSPVLSGSITMVSDFNSLTQSPSISWASASDSGSGLAEYKIAIGTSAYASDIKGWTSVGMLTTTTANSLTLLNGQTYYASVKALDYAGNESSLLTHSWVVDTVLPNLTITSPSNTAYITSSNQANLSVQANCEIGLNVSITVVSQVLPANTQTHVVACTSGSIVDSFDVTSYPEGSIQISASQTDNAGNSKSVAVLNTKDTIAPTFSNMTVSDGVYFNSLSQSPPISWFAASDANNIMKYQIAVGSWSGASDIFTWTDIGNVISYQITSGLSLSDGGTYYPSIRAVDMAGNTSNSISGNGWHVDATPPTIPISVVDDNQWGSSITSPTISWGLSSDTNSGISSYKVRILDLGNTPITSWENAGNANTYSFSGLSLSPGTIYHVEVKALDLAGNESTVAISDGWQQVDLGWKAESFIKAVNADASDSFGTAVAIDNNTLVVGVPNEASNQTTITNGNTASADNSAGSSGAVYVYKRTWNQGLYKYEWDQEAYIKASNSESLDSFGYTVSVFDDTLAVGAIFESSNQTTITNGTTSSSNNSATNSGAVYIYKRSGSNWSQEAYIKASNAGASDNFGMSVNLKNDLLFVGATYESSNQTYITNGATSSSDNSAISSGAVYVYKRSGSIWAQEAYIKASNVDSSDNFGISLAFDIDTLVVGARGESSNQTIITNGSGASSDNSLASSGAVYVYRRSGTTWSQEAYIKASNADSLDYFGSAVAISGNTIVVGAHGEDSNQTFITNGTSSSAENSSSYSGAIYVYTRSGTVWSQEAYIKPSNSAASNFFGYNVAIFGNRIASGAYGEDSNQSTITNGNSASSDASLMNSGAVYVFTRTGANWEQTAYIKAPNPSANDYFGNHISLMNNTLSISATSEDSSHTNIQNSSSGFTYDEGKPNSGAVYVFKFD